MSQVFHEIEKKIIASLRDNPKQSPESLEKSTQLSPDQIRRGIEWLKLKNLAIVTESKSRILSLGKNGVESFTKGLPERRLLDLLKTGPRKLSDLQKELGFVFGPSMGLARKNNWIEVSLDEISIKEEIKNTMFYFLLILSFIYCSDSVVDPSNEVTPSAGFFMSVL